MNSEIPFPDFENPPVTEVVLSAQFVPLDKMTAVHIGSLWNSFRENFPEVEQHGPVEHQVEIFGGMVPLKSSVRFKILDMPPTPRCWFKRSDGTELIQVQNDRFMHNWRKIGDESKYPRFEKICESFGSELEQFSDFVTQENLGKLLPDQSEVTYINHIISGDGWNEFGDLGEILSTWTGQYSNDWLSEPEKIKISEKHLIKDSDANPVGRLHIDLESAYTSTDRKPMFILSITGRVTPPSATIEGILKGLDISREWIVKGFTAVTTEKMRKEVWRQK